MSNNCRVSDGVANGGKTDEEHPSTIKSHHPKTIAEAVAIVAKELSPETLDIIRQKDKEQFLASSHCGLGASIRNYMIFCNDNLFDLMADFQKGCREGKWEGPPNVDGVSEVIVQLVWEQLHQA